MPFTLEQLRCFVAVAKHLHFGKAADELTMTQPPLSRQIQKLEKSVGATLLERDSRRVSLTAAGEAFLDEAQFILTRVDNAGERAQLVSQGIVGRINLSYTSAAGFTILGKVLTLAKEKLPNVDLSLQEMVTMQQVDALRKGEADLGFGRVSEHIENIRVIPAFQEDLVLALPCEHPLGHKPLLRRSDVEGLPLIMHDKVKAQYFHDLVVRHFPAHLITPTHALSQINTMVKLVSEGHGVALVPSSAESLRIEGVTFKHFEDLKPNIAQLHALIREDSRNPAAASLAELIPAALAR